jgi:YD repeat-containing protein
LQSTAVLLAILQFCGPITGLNRNTTVTDAAGHATTLAYNALNKTGRTDALGQATTYLYDARNRLQNVVYASATAANSQRNYAYDSDGNLLSVTEPAQTAADVAHSYDALNRAVSETSDGLTHTYGYDLAGNRSNPVLPILSF